MIIHFHFHPLPILLTYLTIIPQTISIAIPQSPSNINTITNSHPNLGSWHALPPIPISPRKEHATVYLEPYIYILGGVTPTNDPTHPFEPTTLTQRYSLETNTWSTVAPLPLPLTHPNAAVINGAIYLLGGLTPSSPLNPTLLTTAPNSYIYHPETNIWSPLSLDIPPSLQVAAAATASRGNSIYLAGGLTHFNLNISSPSPPTPKITNSFTAYTSGRELLTSLPPLPQSRYRAASGFLEDIGLFFVIGGRGRGEKDEKGDVTYDVKEDVKDTNFVYDFRVNAWGERKRMSRAREGMASAVVGSQIFVMGGLGGRGGDEDVGEDVGGDKGEEVLMLNEAYDVLTDEWREYAPMDVPRHDTSAIAINQRIYIPGGGISGGGSTDYFSYFEVP